MTTSGHREAWPPRTEEQLHRAAQSGVLVESRYLDIKRELEPGQSANKSFAKDIAAFSLEGGVILIGVDEDSAPPTLHAVDLAGLAERVEQIAATAVDEGVVVNTTEIQASDKPGHGYLVVEIPMSPRAPHMASEKYYGRGDKTNRVLSHAEVLRIHERQAAEQRDIIVETREGLDELRGENPDASPNMVFLLAKPLGAREDLLLPLSASGSPEWKSDVMQLVRSAAVLDRQQFSPTLSAPSGLPRRPGGVAATVGMHEGKRFSGTDRAAEVTLGEGGILSLASECSIILNRRSHRCVFESLIIGHTDLIVRLAAIVSQYGFAGSWRFGLVVTGLKDTTSYALSSTLWWHDELENIYTRETYEQGTMASLEQLKKSPQSVVRALVGSLLRSLGSQDQWPWLLT
jgi:hypothetical protein